MDAGGREESVPHREKQNKRRGALRQGPFDQTWEANQVSPRGITGGGGGGGKKQKDGGPEQCT